MRYRRFEALGRELSLLVLGTALWEEREPRLVQELTDTWLELGGNVFDSGRQYGRSERILAKCLGERRGEVAILTKGAHHDEEYPDGPIVRRRVTPADIALDLGGSLDALATDRVDIYMLHRDDPSRPVGPIVEELNEHLGAGRILSFGASNWTPERLDEAARFAAERGLQTFTSASVYLGLATQNEPPWLETVSARHGGSRAWYGRTQMPLFAWSAQAAGYFAGHVDAEVARVYENDGNRERRRRARELGDRRGATANQVALAWVLNQPFATYAIIGPRSVAELRESVDALELELSRDDVRWLDLEEDPWET